MRSVIAVGVIGTCIVVNAFVPLWVGFLALVVSTLLKKGAVPA